MYLTDIHIRNFRVYEGDHSLSLTPPTPERNVCLVGGLNGAGKTSLFGAVALALYGRDASGLVFERGSNDNLGRAYRRYLEESFSFAARAQGKDEMTVRLGLNHEGATLRIQRTWWFSDGQFDDESLTIYEDGKPLGVDADTEEDRQRILQEYVEGIAPARVAKFFFFDGEEIRSIAARDPDQAVVEGLNQLLGFHALRRLVEDLRTLQTSIRRELPGASDAGLAAALEEREIAVQALDTGREELMAARSDLGSARSRLASVEDEIRTLFEGRSFQSRSEALDAIATRERELAAISAELQNFVAEVLTLSLPGALLERTAKRARTEARKRRGHEAKRRLRPLRDRLIDSVLSKDGSSETALSRAQKASIKRRFHEAWDVLVEGKSTKDNGWFTQLSTDDLERVPKTATEVVETARRELLARVARRSHIQAELARLRSIDGLFEGGSRAQELLEAKGKLLQVSVETEARVSRLEREVERAEQEVATRKGLVTKIEQQLAMGREITAELDVARRLELAAETFMAELRRTRSEALAERTTEMMRHLAHKEDLVHRIEIDSEDFGMRILDRHGEEVLNLSAGEREIYALSLVWGLAQISNRSLPVMIDTPLGRLDQMHRSNVVQDFLPRAGEQVIVLATDSEIDDRWYIALKPHIAQEILIEFSDEMQSSMLKPGQYLDLDPSREEVAR